MTKLKAWISAARLRTLPLSVSGIITGGAAAIEADSYSETVFYLALATTLGFQILSNFANDYGDGVKGSDNAERVGPARALQSGWLTAKALKRGMIITAVLTILLVSMLIFSAFGNENFLLSFLFFNLGIAAIIAAVKYTVGKSAYGYRAMGDVFVFIFFGLVGVMGSYFLFTQKLDNYILLPALTIGLLSTAVLNLNNMRDRLADAKVKKITLAVLLGETKVKYYHTSLIIAAFMSATMFFTLHEMNLLSFLPLVAFIPLFLNILKVNKNRKPEDLDPELKKVALSTFLFSILYFITTLV
jgi:1,4-dihydroxy-2-naphthoate octaprenyltransferase